MSNFERTYQTDPSREVAIERECGRIELTDQEHLEKINKSLKTTSNCVPMPFTFREDVLQIRNEIENKKGIKDARNKSKSPKKKAIKNNPKANKPAVARIQKEL